MFSSAVYPLLIGFEAKANLRRKETVWWQERGQSGTYFVRCVLFIKNCFFWLFDKRMGCKRVWNMNGVRGRVCCEEKVLPSRASSEEKTLDSWKRRLHAWRAIFLLQAAYRCQLTEVVQQSASVLWRNFVGSSDDSPCCGCVSPDKVWDVEELWWTIPHGIKAGPPPPLIWVFGHFWLFAPWYRRDRDASSVKIV